MKTRLRNLLSLLGTALMVLAGIGVIVFGASYLTASSPDTANGSEAPAAGGEAYKLALANSLKARGYEGFEPKAVIEGGKFRIEAAGKVGACTIELRWVVGAITAAQQAAPSLPPGTVVTFKLAGVMQASDGRMAKYALAVANPSPVEVQEHLKRHDSPCKP